MAESDFTCESALAAIESSVIETVAAFVIVTAIPLAGMILARVPFAFHAQLMPPMIASVFPIFTFSAYVPSQT